MRDDIREADAFVALPVFPPRFELPATRDHPDDAVPFDDGTNLFVGKLPLMGIQGAAVVVARMDRAAVAIKRFPECLIRTVGKVQDDPHAGHLGQKGGSELCQS